MLNSSETAKQYPDEMIPGIPGLNTDDEVKAIIAMHLEKTVFQNHDENTFQSAVEQIFEDFGISDKEDQERIKRVFLMCSEILPTVVQYLQREALGKDKNSTEKGTFEYPAQPYIYYDDEECYWCVDIEKLQEMEAKYDNIDLSSGQIIFIFNPTERRGRLIVDNTGMKVRTAEESGLLQNMQAMLAMSAQCTCGNKPCTCGSGNQNQLDDDSSNEFEEWDKLMSKANDRDVILVYQDGEEAMRF
jgi:hypothetical protein